MMEIVTDPSLLPLFAEQALSPAAATTVVTRAANMRVRFIAVPLLASPVGHFAYLMG
jgi:hypothetical protein